MARGEKGSSRDYGWLTYCAAYVYQIQSSLPLQTSHPNSIELLN